MRTYSFRTTLLADSAVWVDVITDGIGKSENVFITAEPRGLTDIATEKGLHTLVPGRMVTETELSQLATKAGLLLIRKNEGGNQDGELVNVEGNSKIVFNVTPATLAITCAAVGTKYTGSLTVASTVSGVAQPFEVLNADPRFTFDIAPTSIKVNVIGATQPNPLKYTISFRQKMTDVIKSVEVTVTGV